MERLLALLLLLNGMFVNAYSYSPACLLAHWITVVADRHRHCSSRASNAHARDADDYIST
jgi:hypothetical protein